MSVCMYECPKSHPRTPLGAREMIDLATARPPLMLCCGFVGEWVPRMERSRMTDLCYPFSYPAATMLDVSGYVRACMR
jgi:hypothetical protein